MRDHLNQFFFNCFQSFILGIIQGITEFFPISSTAHLKIIPYFIGWNDPGVSISASLQLGSAFAIIFYFRKEISLIINSFSSILKNPKLIKKSENRLACYIFLGSLPIFIIGFIIKLFWSNYSNSYFRGLFFIAFASIIMASLLALSEFYGKRNKYFKDINIRDIVLIGISQCLAIFPGVSRSGITLTAALFSGIERETAARFSFLIGIPAISISGFIELITLFRTSSSIDVIPTLIGIISSFISSIFAIKFLLRFLVNNNIFIFVYYRLAFGMFILFTL